MTVMVVERDIELGSNGIGYGSTNAETGKRARARHKGDFGDVCEGFIVFCKLSMNKL